MCVCVWRRRGESLPDATLFTTRVILICMKMGSDESHFGVLLLSWAPRPYLSIYLSIYIYEARIVQRAALQAKSMIT